MGLKTPIGHHLQKEGPTGRTGLRDSGRGAAEGWAFAAFPSHGHNTSARTEATIQTSLHPEGSRALASSPRGSRSVQKACRLP